MTANPAPNWSRGDAGDDERDAARLVAHRRPVTTVRLYARSRRIDRSVKRIGTHCLRE